MSPEDELKNKLYRNWVKAELGLKYLKAGLENFVNNEVTGLHTTFLNDIGNKLELKNVTCGQCSYANVLPCPTKGICIVKKKLCTSCHGHNPTKCPNKICDEIYTKIVAEHCYRSPSWKNTDVSKWCTNPWEIAKCFMAESGYKNSATAAETDCTGILSVAINGKFMQNVLATLIIPPGDIFSKNRQARNSIMHSPTLEVTDAELVQYIDDMIALLNDTKQLVNHPDAVIARQKLEQLKTDKLVISTKDELKIGQEALKAIDCKKQEALQDLENKLLESVEVITSKETKASESLINLYDEQKKNLDEENTKAVSGIDKTGLDAKISIQTKLDESLAILHSLEKNLDDTRDKAVSDIDKHAEDVQSEIGTSLSGLQTSLHQTLNAFKQAQDDCQQGQSSIQEQLTRIQQNCKMSRPSLEKTSDTGDDTASKTWKKFQENPAMPIGITGALSVLGYQLYNYKFKSEKVPLSLFLIRTRMFAQGSIVFCLMLAVGPGVVKHFYQKFTNTLPEKVPGERSTK